MTTDNFNHQKPQDDQETAERYAAMHGVGLSSELETLVVIKGEGAETPIPGHAFVDGKGNPSVVPMSVRRSNGEIHSGWTAVGIHEEDAVPGSDKTAGLYYVLRNGEEIKIVPVDEQEQFLAELRGKRKKGLAKSVVTAVSSGHDIVPEIEPLEQRTMTPEQLRALRERAQP